MTTGDTLIKIKRSETVGSVPTGLTAGELAINIADQRVFVGNESGNTVTLFAGPSAEQPAGQDGQLNFMFNGGFSASDNLYFSGSTLGITGGITMSGDLNLGGNLLLPEDGEVKIGGDTEKIVFNGAGSGSSSIDIFASNVDFGTGSGSSLRSSGDTNTQLKFVNDKYGAGSDGLELQQSGNVMIDVTPTQVNFPSGGISCDAGATFGGDVIVLGGITASGATFGGDVTVLGGITSSGVVFAGGGFKFADGTTLETAPGLTSGVSSINGLVGAVDVTGSLFEVGGLSADAQGIIIHGGGITIGDDLHLHDGGISADGVFYMDVGRYGIFRPSHPNSPSIAIQSPSDQNTAPFIVGKPGVNMELATGSGLFDVKVNGKIRSGIAGTDVVHAHGISADAGATFGGNVTLQSSGDISLTLNADSDNDGENDNPLIRFSQDGDAVQTDMGMVGNPGQIYTNSITNAWYVNRTGGQALQFANSDTARYTIDLDGMNHFHSGVSADSGATFGTHATVLGGLSASGTVYAGTGIKFSDGLTQGSSQTDIIGIHVHGGKGQLSTGTKGQRVVPYNCSVTEWTTTSSSTGDIEWAVRYGSYSDWPTTVSVGGTQPTITDGYKNQSTSPDWTVKGFTAGTLLEFAITSVDGITSCNLALKIRRDG